MVIPNNTKTSEILMVAVIFAFKNLTVDTFFLFDICDSQKRKLKMAQAHLRPN